MPRKHTHTHKRGASLSAGKQETAAAGAHHSLLRLVLVLDKEEGDVAAAAVLTVALVRSHERVAARGDALAAQTRDLAVVVHLVVVQHRQLDALVLVRDALRRRVDLLLVLLATTKKAQHEVKRALLLDVVVGERVAVLQLLAGKDQTLLVRGDALLVLDLRLHVVDAVPRLDLQRDGLASQSLHENLHVGTHKQKNTKIQNKKVQTKRN